MWQRPPHPYEDEEEEHNGNALVSAKKKKENVTTSNLELRITKKFTFSSDIEENFFFLKTAPWFSLKAQICAFFDYFGLHSEIAESECVESQKTKKYFLWIRKGTTFLVL